MIREIPVRFHSFLRGVVLDSPEAPSPPAAPPPVVEPSAPAERASPQPDVLEERRHQDERAAIERTLAAMMEAARALAAERDQRRSEMQRVAVELAVTIASRLIHERIDAGQFALETLVRQTVERLDPSQPVIVRLHPDDIILLEKRLGNNQPLLPHRKDISIVADPGLERGACRAEAGAVRVLSQWKDQLEEIHQHLLRSVGHARSEP